MGIGILFFIIGCILIYIGITSMSQANTLNIQSENLEKDYKDKLEKLIDREEQINKKENELTKIKKKSQNLTKDIETLQNEKESLQNDIDGLYNDSLISVSKSEIESSLLESSSSEIKNRLSLLKHDEKDLEKDGAIILPSSIDNKSKMNKLQKKLLLPFNSEVSGLLNKLSISNVDSTRRKIISTFDKINKLYIDSGAEISKEYLEFKLNELNFTYSYIVKKNNEKEQQKAIKEQMIDEEKARRELEKEQQKISKESKQFSNELNRTMKYLNKSNDEIKNQVYADKIKELQQKINDLEERGKSVSERILNTRAGYVYIISNIGSFGENIYKIGMTRRLEPMDRIKELSSASVPFEFDVHATIFSDDAPALENHLHKAFSDKSVNKINSRKEFYNVELSQIEKEVINNFDTTVEFTMLAKAEEYRRSLELSAISSD